jgi:hypothetical protein
MYFSRIHPADWGIVQLCKAALTHVSDGYSIEQATAQRDHFRLNVLCARWPQEFTRTGQQDAANVLQASSLPYLVIPTASRVAGTALFPLRNPLGDDGCLAISGPCPCLPGADLRVAKYKRIAATPRVLLVNAPHTVCHDAMPHLAPPVLVYVYCNRRRQLIVTFPVLGGGVVDSALVVTSKKTLIVHLLLLLLRSADQLEPEIAYGTVRYALQSITFHHGTPESGHFTAAIRDQNNEWWYCDGLGHLYPKDSYAQAQASAAKWRGGGVGSNSFLFYSRIAH